MYIYFARCNSIGLSQLRLKDNIKNKCYWESLILLLWGCIWLFTVRGFRWWDHKVCDHKFYDKLHF